MLKRREREFPLRHWTLKGVIEDCSVYADMASMAKYHTEAIVQRQRAALSRGLQRKRVWKVNHTLKYRVKKGREKAW